MGINNSLPEFKVKQET